MTSLLLNSGTVSGDPGIFCETVKVRRNVSVSVILTANSTSRASGAWEESATFVTEIDSVSWIDSLTIDRNVSRIEVKSYRMAGTSRHRQCSKVSPKG